MHTWNRASASACSFKASRSQAIQDGTSFTSFLLAVGDAPFPWRLAESASVLSTSAAAFLAAITALRPRRLCGVRDAGKAWEVEAGEKGLYARSIWGLESLPLLQVSCSG